MLFSRAESPGTDTPFSAKVLCLHRKGFGSACVCVVVGGGGEAVARGAEKRRDYASSDRYYRISDSNAGKGLEGAELEQH